MVHSEEAFVRFKNVQKSYDGEVLVVKNFNLDIRQGEFVTMLGPSGSGKTTCLMILAGFETATEGEIYIDGQAVNKLAAHKRDIGMVFQNYALFPHMTIAENLAFPLTVRKLAKEDIAQKVEKSLAMVELQDMGHRRPAQLSGGQQQRVALARALIFEPKLILMDEPLGALDKQLREQMQYEIKQLHERLGITVLYVTHDQSEALTMSDRIAVFNEGIVQQIAPPAELYERPANQFVASFIGENNKLQGRVQAIADKCCVVNIAASENLMVNATPVNVSRAGDNTTLSVRPERIVINPSPEAFDNCFDAKIVDLIYHGDHLRTRLDLLGQNDFVVKTPNTSDTRNMVIGQTIKVGWKSVDCHALEAV